MKILVKPIERFFKLETSSSILLFLFTIAALIFANTALQEGYFSIWGQKLTIGAGQWELSKPLILWINDGLMAIFFFVIGLEIKREIIAGELSSLRKAALPFFAAIGGMLMPLTIFLLLNGGKPGSTGWGIPMATDIAFSLGILKLLGKRVPLSMKVFLTTFAIVDDIGAVIIIGLFYSAEIAVNYLIIAFAIFAVLIVLNKIGVHKRYIYILPGLVIWYLFLKSGIHPTVAGVMLAFVIPANKRILWNTFVDEIKYLAGSIKLKEKDNSFLNPEQLNSVDYAASLTSRVQPRLQQLENTLHGWVAFFIMPVFAFANAGVILGGSAGYGHLSLNIALSLILGKVIGVSLFSWIAVKSGVSEFGQGMKMIHIIGLGFLGAIGFTMALFINNLAFTDAALIDSAKIGILTGSLVAAIVGFIILHLTIKKKAKI